MFKRSSLIIGVCAIGIMVASAVSVFAATTSRDSSATTPPEKPGFARTHVLTADQQAKFDALKAEHDKIMQAALDGDYDTWQSLISAIKTPDGKTLPILDKINEDNFADYSKALNLDKQAEDIFSTLGLKGEGMGMGFGREMGFGRGHK